VPDEGIAVLAHHLVVIALGVQVGLIRRKRAPSNKP
jgi:hypothetical protein